MEKVLDYCRMFEVWMHKPTEVKDPKKVQNTILLFLVASFILMFLFG